MSNWQQTALGELQTHVRRAVAVPPQGSRPSMVGWQQLTLGDLLTRVRRKVAVEDGVTYPAVSVQMYGRGLGEKEPFIGGISKYTTLNSVRENDVVLRTITAFEAPAGVARAEHDGTHVSGVFITYEVDRRALPEFLRLYFQTPVFWDEMQNRASGTVLRRKTISDASFSSIPITLPPLPVQQQIVGIISAVDDQIAAVDSEASTARRLLNMVLAEHFTAVEGERHRIVDLCSHVVGGVWGKPEGEGEVDRLALGPRIYTPNTSDFVTDGSPVRSFTTKQAATRTVQEQDIILERSGGSPEQPVGRVAIAGPGLEPCVPTDFQRLMRVDPEKALPRYVFWRLRHDWASGLTHNYSRRTTGITNLSVKEYIAREIPVPSSEEQAGLVERAEAVDALIVTLRAEAASLRRVRASLLSGLLDRTIDIESAELGV
ncbi:restriction endonuclease subunit S [Streptomyces sp. JJ66]|uniref:restriction endonuclease subunit S n=1 Tax=Streptomyces sp. JJ66 TaxID=2803843 RepID=UPI001C5A4162|nr:restriction endonuclease subunit S [Streptomyces sp. JJ66]MBW1602359.1 restriction endonuclease subunit S [Streptomyces sp. JJ66]